MNQNNYGGANYQVQTGADNTNFFGGEHRHEHHHYYTQPILSPEETSKNLTDDETPTAPPLVQSFRFKFATIEFQRSGLMGRTRKPLIKSHSKQAKYFVEALGGGIDLEMVLIPGDSFLMGTLEDESSRHSEHPQHRVTVNPFFMSKYLVTQAQWKAIAHLSKANPSLDPNPAKFKESDHPVEQVSWDDATEFCTRLSRRTGRLYRLPTEAEWEYACRAGTSTQYHFGESIASELANYGKSSASSTEHRGTTPCGSFKVANAFGLYDMHGNVWEWCMDHWHNNYNRAPANSNAWLKSKENQLRVIRGGSWSDPSENCRSACRKSAKQSEKGKYLGFRIVCSFE